MLGLRVKRNAVYVRVKLGYINLDLGPPNKLLEIPERGPVRFVETLGGNGYNLWAGPVTDWNTQGSLGSGDYLTETGCCGTLESVRQPQDESGFPWSPMAGQPVHSILVNGQTRLYRVTQQ